RYYFDVRKDDSFAPDKEGLELCTIEAAQEEAARSSADMHGTAPQASRRRRGTERGSKSVTKMGRCYGRSLLSRLTGITIAPADFLPELSTHSKDANWGRQLRFNANGPYADDLPSRSAAA
ncbi:DUF6894 family protein, partial [Bradyrhizobium sp. sGM-13]|uniref:DUF6894 family protein n=1 Tax=Bradyrhizobium sp. sGM-13 TaxID=2831781 RepID=UPI001BD04C9D